VPRSPSRSREDFTNESLLGVKDRLSVEHDNRAVR
jgi:hypothetical protein